MLVLPERASDLRAARTAFAADGIGVWPVTRGNLANGDLTYVLLELTRKP